MTSYSTNVRWRCDTCQIKENVSTFAPNKTSKFIQFNRLHTENALIPDIANIEAISSSDGMRNCHSQ